LVTAVLKPKEGKFTFDVRNKFLPQRAGGASTAAQRSCGAPSLEALKARLDGALGSLSWWRAPSQNDYNVPYSNVLKQTYSIKKKKKGQEK